MALQTIEGHLRFIPCLDHRNDIAVALAARVVRYPLVPAFNLDRLREIAGRESQRMIEAVQSLGIVFSDESFRRMTIVADGSCMMAVLVPGIEVIFHNMTVRACRRIVSYIRKALSIYKRINPDAGKNAEKDTKDNQRDFLPR
jgi:hypothetical protein